MTIAAIGSDIIRYKKLLPNEYPSISHDISRVASGQYAVEIIEARDTYFESASITTKMARRARKTL